MNLDGNQASIREVIDAGLLAGAVTLVWQGGKVLQVGELGHRDVNAGLPMQRDTIFRIASMSKPVTVAAAMALVEEGKFALGDAVAPYLPEIADLRVMADPAGPLDKTVPLQRPITFDDLMTHRSGLAYAFSVGPPLSRAYGKLMFRQDQDRWLAELARLPLAHQPGDHLTYSHATDVLGIAVSRIEGKPLADVLAERIFGPLGMTSSGFSVSHEGRRRAATMYQLDEQNTLRDDVMGPAPVVPPTFCAGGAGLWSTADDYLAFIRMLLGNGTVDGVRVLSEESVRMMRTDRLTDEQKKFPFLGMPFWRGPGLRAELVGGHRSGTVTPAVRAWRIGHVQLARRLRDVVAGRPVGGPDHAVPHPEPSGPEPRRCRRCGGWQYGAGQAAGRPAPVRPSHLRGAGALSPHPRAEAAGRTSQRPIARSHSSFGACGA
ncbi:MAG: hypothetical protein JWR34_7762 [Mycobacterium sp.]|nr:hypothetical protein [Mycobacterium sp.]